MNTEIVKSVLNMYKIQYKKIYEPQSGYRNQIWPVMLKDKTLINLTFFKYEPNIVGRIQRSSELSDWLYKKGLPTRQQLDKKLVVIKWAQFKRIAGIFTYLPGNTIAWESYTKDHLKLLGLSMADLHKNLNSYKAPLPSVYDECKFISNKMENYFTDNKKSNAMNNKLKITVDTKYINKLLNNVLQCKKLPNQQALHLDYVRGNILYQNVESSKKYKYKLNKVAITGILDFEKACLGYVGIDIARTMAFLFVDCKYKYPSDVYKYFLNSGYINKGKRSSIDLSMLTNLILFFLLYDFYKFLAHNPYEYLYSNNHYIRTRSILLHFGIIKQEK